MNTLFSTRLVTAPADADRPTSRQERALVLGGGGSAGNAWVIGVLAGLFEAGLDVTDADLIIGTSAGSTAAVQATSATPTDLLGGILAPAPERTTAPPGAGAGRRPAGPPVNHLE